MTAWTWRRDDGDDVELDGIVERATAAAREGEREIGCCCESVIRVAGWVRGEGGPPAPFLLASHDWWCPLLRSQETFGSPERIAGLSE